jgi:transposase-like protein
VDKVEKRCLVELLRNRYRFASKKARGAILDELVERIGVGL